MEPPTTLGSKRWRNRSTYTICYATILNRLGFDHTKLPYRYSGRDFRLTDVEGEVIQEILT